MKVVPLSSDTIYEACKLTKKVFGGAPAIAFQASLNGGRFNKSGRINDWTLCSYFIGIENDQVIATTGIYFHRPGARSAWLGWFCVHPSYRGMGLGQELFDFSEWEARAQGASLFRLWTEKNNRRAHALYEKNGMRRIFVKSENSKAITYGKSL